MAHEKGTEHVSVRRIDQVLEKAFVPGDHSPSPYSYDDAHRIVAISGITDRVSITATHKFDRLWFFELVQPLERVSDLSSLFEPEVGGCPFHAFTEAPANLDRPSLEKREYVVDHLSIVGSRLISDTRSTATLYVVVQAWALHCVTGQVIVARPDSKKTPDNSEGTTEDADIGVGTKKLSARNVDATDNENARKRLAKCYGNARVTLIVPETDVERWPVLLDEIVFEQQRLRIGRHDDGLEVGNLPPQHEILGAEVGMGPEVLPDARP
jgi:hypothetical protein